jgi:hypothetical protein
LLKRRKSAIHSAAAATILRAPRIILSFGAISNADNADVNPEMNSKSLMAAT